MPPTDISPLRSDPKPESSENQPTAEQPSPPAAVSERAAAPEPAGGTTTSAGAALAVDLPNPHADYAHLLRESKLPRAEARRLMSMASGRGQTWLIAHEGDVPDTACVARFLTLAERRSAGEPLAYLLGEQEFFGRPFRVSPEVLIPRSDTETLIEVALERVNACARPGDRSSARHVIGEAHRYTARPEQRPSSPTMKPAGAAGPAAPVDPIDPVAASTDGLNARKLRILDLGTGSGIIAITLALEVPGAEVHALERSDGALAVARQNASSLGASIEWHRGSWWEALASAVETAEKSVHEGEPGTMRNRARPPRRPTRNQNRGSCQSRNQCHDRQHGLACGRQHDKRLLFDLIVSNPPYIAAGDAHLNQGDLRFEPLQALAAGMDGLDDLRTIVAGAPDWLTNGGWLLLEHGYDQENAARELLHAAGFVGIFTRCDLAGQPRVSGGQWLAKIPERQHLDRGYGDGDD